MQPDSSDDTAWKNSYFISLERSDFHIVIYKSVVARKIRLTRRFSLFCLLINKRNKWMKYLAGWRGVGVVYSATSGCFDLVGRCCPVTLLGQLAIQLTCDLCLAYLYLPNFKHRLQKILLVEKKKMIGIKISLFYMTENFLGILDRLCMEPMCRSHNFLSLKLTVVRSTSGSCYFLVQCRCLWVCVLCVLVVRCVKS